MFPFGASVSTPSGNRVVYCSVLREMTENLAQGIGPFDGTVKEKMKKWLKKQSPWNRHSQQVEWPHRTQLSTSPDWLKY